MEKVRLAQNTKIFFATGGRHHFFGYYDKCPWSKNGRFLLAMEVDFFDRLPNEHDVASIGIIDLQGDRKFKKIAETRAWNWQQGCRLQWLPPNYDRHIIFNDFQNGRFVSVIFDIQTREKKILPIFVYAVSPNGKFALTVNFARLQWVGGYGYAGLEDPYRLDLVPKNDGIYKLDLKTSKSELILSIAEVAANGCENSQNKTYPHYLTHPLFNKVGTRFCFLHRSRLDDGGMHTRLFTANPDGSDLYCLAEGNLSHFDWFTDSQILIWGRHRPFLAKIRKQSFFKLPIFKPMLSFIRSRTKGFFRHRILGDRCLLFTDKAREVKSIGLSVLTEDGHFSRFGNSPWILGDTYPDKNHYRNLFIYNLDTNKKIELGKFYSLPDEKYKVDSDWDNSGMRSDLHPRFNRDGTKICIDSVHEGTRQIYVLDIRNLI